ncbi:MAG: ACT domain-containing protein [Rhodoglobus sp.]
MSGLTDLEEMIGSLEPALRDGEYVFVSVSAEQAGALPAEATIREDEGVTVVLLREQADAAGLAYDFVARWISLTVHSSLSAVGLTAAFATALGEAGISCNVLAAYHHDHILVPADDAERALETLRELARTRGRA